MRNGSIVGIVSSGILILAAGLVYKEVEAQKFSNKVKALEKSAEWYVGDINLPDAEKRFIYSLEDLKNNPGIETAQMAQQASMINLVAICRADPEMPRPLLRSALNEFMEHADAYLERLTLVEGHDEFVADYRSRVKWRKDLAMILSQYGPRSYEVIHFLDDSIEEAKGEEYRRKMAELDRIWEEKYATPQGRINRELFRTRRDSWLNDFEQLRNTSVYRAGVNHARTYPYKVDIH